MTKRGGVPEVPRPKRKRGRPADAEIVQRALDQELTDEISRTATVVMRSLRRLAERGEAIPVTLLSAARLCMEWHTDYLTVKNAMAVDDEVSGAAGE